MPLCRPSPRPRKEDRTTKSLPLLRHRLTPHNHRHVRRWIQTILWYFRIRLPRLHVIQSYWFQWCHRWYSVVDLLGRICQFFNYRECYDFYRELDSFLLHYQECFLHVAVPPQVHGSGACIQANYQVSVILKLFALAATNIANLFLIIVSCFTLSPSSSRPFVMPHLQSFEHSKPQKKEE